MTQQVSQSERFQQARTQLLSEETRILPPGSDVSLDKESPESSPILALIQEVLARNGFSVEVFFSDTNFKTTISDSKYDNSEGGILATQITSIPYEYGYMVLPQIFDYFRNHTELR